MPREKIASSRHFFVPPAESRNILRLPGTREKTTSHFETLHSPLFFIKYQAVVGICFFGGRFHLIDGFCFMG